ncbi:MAG: FtsX-like permease family protein [Oscillospiraceae bacterium]
MKRTYRKVISRTITHTLSRFLAIFAIVALGVGFLAGLMAATPDMQYSGDKYFDETNLSDMRIVSSLGLTDNDIKAVSAIDEIDEIMPGQSADLIMDASGGDTLVVRVNGLPLDTLDAKEPKNYLNRVILTDGRLPKNKNECVIELGGYDVSGVKIGDTITANKDNTNLDDTMAITSFTVVGTVKSAYYFSFEREPSTVGNGTTNLIAYVANEAFSREEYSELYLTVKGVKELNSLSAEYYDKIAKVTKALEAVCDARVEPRLAEVRADATVILDDAKKEYSDKKQEADEKLSDAADKISDGKKEVKKGEREIADAKRKLTDGEKELEQAKIDFAYIMSVNGDKLEEGKKQLADGKKQLAEQSAALPIKEEELNAAKAKYANGKAQLDAGEAGLLQLKDGIAQIAQTIEQLKGQLGTGGDDTAINAQISALTQKSADLTAQYNATDLQLAPQRTALANAATQISTGDKMLADGKAAIAAAKEKLAQSEQELNDGIRAYDNAPATADAEFAKAQAELDKGKRDIIKGEKELADARIELADGEKEYNDEKRKAEEKLSDAQDKLDDADKKIRELEPPDYYVLDRKSIVSFASFDSNISKVDAIARVFPVFFFLVAALVALTTMTRMVEEERLQIGTLKALGYSSKTIAFKYLLYAFLACSLGCVVGLLVGFNLLPRVIWNAYSMMYNLPPLVCQFNVKYAVIASCVSMACTMAATLNACWASLKENPATLMLPRAPKAGKRILLERVTFIWKRMKFTHKVTARNLFRYKKRFFMTVIGIAGCTALLLTGFGLRDSISDIINKQFKDIFLYKLAISAKNEKSIAKDELQLILNDKSQIASYAELHQEKSNNIFGDVTTAVYFVVPKNIDELKTFTDLHERRGKAPITLQNEGVVLTEKLAKRANVNIGDKVTLQNNDKRKGEFTVTGIAENYVENYVYMSGDEYHRGFGQAPLYTGIYAMPTNDSKELHDSLYTALLECDGINNVSFIDDVRVSFDDMLRNITYVVYVLIVSAAVLAFVVLYNLTNINIAEREKEIATIKVLGFFDREVSAYVYRESAMLSLIGTALGLVLGIFLHSFVIRTAEVDAVMFGREIKVLSFVLSAGLTLLFSGLVSLVMQRKLKKISMVESMKAPE